MLIHLAFDLLAYGLAIASAVYYRRLGVGHWPSPVPRDLNMWYFFILTNGVIAGSILFGSLNVYLSDVGPAIGKSILGALVGGIVAVEWFKKLKSIRGSSAAAFVPGLALGIFVGRWGCFFAGLPDFTYGAPSGALPGYDFGDGISRHPVQLYEAFAMLLFLLVASAQLHRGNAAWWRYGFYYFAIFYGSQRFFWEFLKPYPDLFLGLNMFQVLCLILICYGAFMLGRAKETDRASQVT